MRCTWTSSPRRRAAGRIRLPNAHDSALGLAERWVACGAGAYPWLDLCRGAVGASRCWLPSFMITNTDRRRLSLHPCVHGVPGAHSRHLGGRAAVSGIGPMPRTHPGAALISRCLRSNIQRIIVQLQVTNLEQPLNSYRVLRYTSHMVLMDPILIDPWSSVNFCRSVGHGARRARLWALAPARRAATD